MKLFHEVALKFQRIMHCLNCLYKLFKYSLLELACLTTSWLYFCSGEVTERSNLEVPCSNELGVKGAWRDESRSYHNDLIQGSRPPFEIGVAHPEP